MCNCFVEDVFRLPAARGVERVQTVAVVNLPVAAERAAR